MHLPLNTLECYMRDDVLQEATRLNYNFRLAQPPITQLKSPSAEQGEASSAFQ